MLIDYQTACGATLSGQDGNVGTISDLYFEVDDWTIRHIVVDTGKWLPGKQVLLAPSEFRQCDWDRQVVETSLLQQQVKDCPHINTDRPVSQRQAVEKFNRYGVPVYWGPVGSALVPGRPVPIPLSSQVAVVEDHQTESSQSNLRSASEVRSYYINATDGDIGHVEDFIIDDQDWVIRYLVVDTKNWLPGRKVLLSPQWVDSVSWADSIVSVELTRKQIEESPEYDHQVPIHRDYESDLYRYYGLEQYWLP